MTRRATSDFPALRVAFFLPRSRSSFGSNEHRPAPLPAGKRLIAPQPTAQRSGACTSFGEQLEKSGSKFQRARYQHACREHWGLPSTLFQSFEPATIGDAFEKRRATSIRRAVARAIIEELTSRRNGIEGEGFQNELRHGRFLCGISLRPFRMSATARGTFDDERRHRAAERVSAIVIRSVATPSWPRARPEEPKRRK